MVFNPSFPLGNQHIQTLYAPLFRQQPTPKVEIERFELDDGDFVDCYWNEKRPLGNNCSIVILFHGLAGSFESPYIQGVMRALAKKGFASVLMHFRGCSGEANRLPRAYHSGETGDAKAWIEHLHKEYPNSKLYAVGYSVGGNMLLKLLGEEGNATLLSSAISVSAPMDLNITAKRINQGFSKRYQKHLLAPLKVTLLEKYDRFEMELLIGHSRKEIEEIQTIEEFDEKYTAPINGFTSAKDYYSKCSAKQFLKNIKVPTMIVHALDDPFMTPAILPREDEVSKFVSLNILEQGGHVGFVNGTLFSPRYWLEETIVNYFCNS